MYHVCCEVTFGDKSLAIVSSEYYVQSQIHNSNHTFEILSILSCGLHEHLGYNSSLLTKQLSRSTDQGRPWVSPKVTFAWYSLRLEFLLISRKECPGGATSRLTGQWRDDVISAHRHGNHKTNGDIWTLRYVQLGLYMAKRKRVRRVRSRL